MSSMLREKKAICHSSSQISDRPWFKRRVGFPIFAKIVGVKKYRLNKGDFLTLHVYMFNPRNSLGLDS